ncbi:dipeptide epimerase [Exilibacterium tricleocarpae]|uniref:Dipeptide epimerase n=1 Tax=Exilibacterium tricleocarpae TaxID=2591008 RepID=A0A545UA09_9GAMM|nr:N-acetyl-D-Glu racemase DgcA [Exilibacterium tricleocarpae]TQV86269.1 dipeptide epimerase [Exilibacterium tricleocarpae]
MRNVSFTIESWKLKSPFSITGYTFTELRVLLVQISDGGITGRGEATGIYYENESADSILAQAQTAKAALEGGADRQALRELLPRGGARNAIDCALWDLEVKSGAASVWQLTGIEPGRITTVNTLGVDTPERMAAAARSLDTPRIKVKLNHEKNIERLQAIRAARLDAEIIVDVNQGWTFEQLVALAPKFKQLGVAMIEQPLPRGGDTELEGYDSPVTLCGDESCLDTTELEQAARRYQMINIKLDKTGGLTEALDLAERAQALGLELMVGNMLGTSLGMAPAFLIAQKCRYVDLDGPLFLTEDRDHGLSYDRGVVSAPVPALWG